MEKIFSCNSCPQLDEKVLISNIQSGDNSSFDILAADYLYLIRYKASLHKTDNLDFNDLVQEGMLGLYYAAKAYNFNSNASFKTFAALCIERRLLSLHRSADKTKNIPLNTSIPLEDSTENVTDFGSNPEELMISKETLLELKADIMSILTERDRSVLNLYLNGKSYKMMAEELGMNVKGIDNTLQKIRRKLKRIR